MSSTGYVARGRAVFRDDSKLFAVGLLLASIILFLDLMAPLGVAGGVPYVVLVLICLWARHPSSAYLMASVGTLLTIVGYYFSPDGGVLWVVLTNRGLAIFAIWVTALFSAKRIAELRGRELAEKKRHALEKELSEFLGLSSEAIISVDNDGLIRLFNLEAENIFGYEAQEVLGKPLDMLVPGASREAHRRHLEKFSRGSSVERPMALRSEICGMHKDGSEFPAMASISKIESNGQTLYTAILRDITEYKESQERLQHARKLEAIGHLTGGIAHEFNNLLMVIFGNLEMIEDRLGENDPLEVFTTRAMEGARRGASLTEGLLAFSRKQRLETRNVDLNRLVHSTRSLMQRTLGQSVNFETDLEDDLWLLATDIGQVEAALLNFIVNARDAMPEGGTITVRTSNRSLGVDAFHVHEGLEPGNYVVLEVSDTGIGMTAEVKKHAFEPFYTTKAVGKGTGLGLSVVYGFAQQSGGHLEADSEVGKGTTLRLYLPRSEEEESAASEEEQKPEGGGQQSGRILVVEDDDEVRRLAAMQLAALGYDVVEASDAKAALAILKEQPNFDLLFADMALPGGTSGFELVREARAKFPYLKALFTSGYPKKNIIDLVITGDDIAVLQKPYPKSALAESVAAALESD